jgi:hypothetical protein
MEYNLLVTIAIGIVFPFIGWFFNTIITKKIDEGNKRDEAIEKKHKEDIDLIFRKYDDLKGLCVRKDIYEQAMQFHQKEVDSKFVNLVDSMTKQFENVEKNIDGVKALINEKFNHKKME